MPTDHSAGRDGISRPRVIVSVTATADARVKRGVFAAVEAGVSQALAAHSLGPAW